MLYEKGENMFIRPHTYNVFWWEEKTPWGAFNPNGLY